jgi:hypothetical protein
VDPPVADPLAADPPVTDDSLPKVEGAGDAPKPASRKQKTIQPINDLDKDKERLMELAAAETVQEQAADPNPTPEPTAEEQSQPLTEAEAEAAQAQETVAAQPLPAPATHQPIPELSQQARTGLEKQREALEHEVEELVSAGAIDQEASASPVDQPTHDSPPTPDAASDTDNQSDQPDEAAARAVLEAAQHKTATETTTDQDQTDKPPAEPEITPTPDAPPQPSGPPDSEPAAPSTPPTDPGAKPPKTFDPNDISL